LVVGAAVAAIYALGSQGWPAPIAAAIAILFGIWLTGAFHEDGLADAIDGLGGGHDRARRLAIMRDSRIGSFGALAITGALLLRIATLQALPWQTACWLLLAAHAGSRFAGVLIMRTLPYVREDESRAKPLVRSLSGQSFAIAALTTIVTVALAAVALPSLLGGLLLAAGVTLWWRRLLQRLLGGYTGDCLGAAQQLAEIAMGLGTLALWSS
jgi:adenosylcobinamide-GDP ribazoletransferase